MNLRIHLINGTFIDIQNTRTLEDVTRQNLQFVKFPFLDKRMGAIPVSSIVIIEEIPDEMLASNTQDVQAPVVETSDD